ncbi:MAG TPA: DUF3592 domain-containing protein [Candidatus Ozemobacteraceae bacterium]|nr:DUF3592 domain-containing protein [Candidatus Ozemobacteraceae bacterium]
MSYQDVMSASMRGSGFVFLLLSALFLLIGIFLLMAGALPLYEYHVSASWKNTPAYVEKLDWIEEEGEDSTFYAVKGSYRYQWGSETYRCERITAETGKSSDRASWQEIYDALKTSRDTGAPVMVRVDPSTPANAIAVRKMTTGLLVFPILGSVFLILGSVFLAGGIWSIVQRKPPIDPDRPWIGDGPWEGFQIKSGGWSDIILAWGVALSISLFESIFVVFVFGDPTVPMVVKGLLGVFILFAVALIVRAAYITVRRMKYGDSLLLLSQIPLIPGGEFAGVVLTKRSLKADDGCKATLRCIAIIRKESGGSDNETTYSEDVQYEKSVIVRADLNRGPTNRSAIPVRFDIPGHLPVRFLNGYPQIRWKLVLEAETPGVNYFAEFELPVYAIDNPSLVQYRSTDA